MQTRVDDAFRRRARALELRHRCEDCAHFDPDRGSCAEGYPNAAHRDVDLDSVETIEFCKSFELV